MKYIRAIFATLIVFTIGCMPKLSPTYFEIIPLGSIHHQYNDQPNFFNFKCPENEFLYLVIRLKSEGLSDNEIGEIRKTWDNHYSVFVRIYDSKDVLVFSETFNKERGNISTGGNWMEPDVSFILLKSVEQSLTLGNTYRVEISLTGDGLQDYSLDLLINRAYLKNK